ncbi:hypothetical protein KUCAC02_015989, partial [Chaenocephalus aceratus]
MGCKQDFSLTYKQEKASLIHVTSLLNSSKSGTFSHRNTSGRNLKTDHFRSDCQHRSIYTCFRIDTMPKPNKGNGKAPEKVCHPYSRKAAYLAGEEIRLKKKNRSNKDKATRLSGIGEKLMWFQENLDTEKTAFTKKDACYIVERYLQRFEPELEQIELVNGIKGKLSSNKPWSESWSSTNVGFEIPDIINAKNLKTFREWTGDVKKLPNIKLRK